MLWICTHHRCGTVLASNIFRKYSELTGDKFFKGQYEERPIGTTVYQDPHSRTKLPDGAFGIHLYRSPWDLLLSHIRYHEVTDSPTEPPNTVIMDDGRLYGDHLRELRTLDEKALFEIDNVYGRTLKSMLAWDYSDKRFVNIPLDALALPEIGAPVLKCLAQNFERQKQNSGLLVEAYRGVLADSRVKEKHGTRRHGEHAREQFSDHVRERVETAFPGVVELERRVANATDRLRHAPARVLAETE